MVTPFYAAILAVIFIALSFRTLLLRRARGIPIGTADDPVLARAARAHANFSEYVPLTLLLLYFLETRTNAGMGLHVLCVSLIVGRLVHAYGVSQVDEDYRFRVFGMVITLGTMISAATRILASYVS